MTGEINLNGLLPGTKQVLETLTEEAEFLSEFRDYYDIYTLSFHMDLEEIYRNALMLMDGLNYKLFSMALIYVEDIADENISHLNPKVSITKQQISEYFISRLREKDGPPA